MLLLLAKLVESLVVIGLLVVHVVTSSFSRASVVVHVVVLVECLSVR